LLDDNLGFLDGVEDLTVEQLGLMEQAHHFSAGTAWAVKASMGHGQAPSTSDVDAEAS
jgi:hypothetical protein